MAITIKSETSEVRLKIGFKESENEVVALRDSISKKLPNRPDNSAQCWIDWDGDGLMYGYIDVYIFFPINNYKKYLEDIKPEIGEDRYKFYLEYLESNPID